MPLSLTADLEELLELAVGEREAVHRPGAVHACRPRARHAPRAQRHAAAAGAELHRVRQQVVDDLLGLAHVQLRARRGPRPSSRSRRMRCAAAFSRTIDRLLDSRLSRSTGSSSSAIMPASTFDRSRMSLISESRCCAAGEDVADVLVLAGAQLAHQAVLERLGEADDRVQRRAQLVRHGRQELGLHPAGVLELDVLFLQRALDALALGDVAGGREHALQLAVAVVEGGGVVGHHGLLAVARAHRQLVVAAPCSRPAPA